MTRMKLSEMSDSQKRLSIAKQCGWTITNEELWTGVEPTGFGYGIIPNYLKDLNAMHEAEKTIGAGDKGFEYQRNLELTSNCRHADKWWAVCATARERADAFLLTTQIAEL